MNTKPAGSALAVESISKSYATPRGRVPVLQRVSLSVERGAFVTLLGPSGAGKSTLLNIMAGLEPPDAGQVRILGERPTARPPIAYMQQKDLLMDWRTVWGNVLLGPELESRRRRAELAGRARELLREFDLEKFAEAYPAQLSGGMRQRAALIRTLLCGQEIMLLDEPFGAVDALTRRRLQEHLLRVWETMGKTIVLITHDVEEALLLSTRIVLLSHRPGRVLGSMEVDLPHGQRARSAEMLALKSRILQRLAEDERIAS